MRVLLTGASSFTGAWFAQALLEADCEVVAALRGSARGRKGVAAERLALVRRGCELVPRVPFGSPAFLDLLRGAGPFDILCHHGAVVGDHRRGGFDVGPPGAPHRPRPQAGPGAAGRRGGRHGPPR